MVAFSHHAKVLNKICLCYTGLAPEYAVQLDYIRSVIKKTYPELSIDLCLTEEFLPLVTDAFTCEQLNISNYSYIKEFKIDPKEHTVLNFINGLSFPSLQIKRINNTCLICPDAAYPSRPLSQEQVLSLTKKIHGFSPVIVGSDLHPNFPSPDIRPYSEEKIKIVENAGWVIGAENEYVFMAAARGIQSSLVPSGIGTELYKQLFPHGELLR